MVLHICDLGCCRRGSRVAPAPLDSAQKVQAALQGRQHREAQMALERRALTGADASTSGYPFTCCCDCSLWLCLKDMVLLLLLILVVSERHGVVVTAHLALSENMMLYLLLILAVSERLVLSLPSFWLCLRDIVLSLLLILITAHKGSPSCLCHRWMSRELLSSCIPTCTSHLCSSLGLS